MHKMQVAGAEVLVKQIIERLKGVIEATVICLDGIGELGHQLQESGTTVLNLNRKPGLDWKVANRLAFELKNHRIEIVHAHQYSPFFYTALARCRYGAKVKVMFTEHGRHYPDIVSWKRRTVNRLYLQRFSDVTTACCDFSTLALQENDGFATAFTLRNGVDIQTFATRGSDAHIQLRRKQLGLKSETLYVACIARMNIIKDHATLIRAWELVHQRLPNARLLLIGDGELRGAIEKQISEANLNDSVELLGIRSDIGTILRSVDVFTLTSHSEAASLTLLEAMGSGCASVVTDVGGNREHLRDSVDGFLVPRSDSVALANRLIELLLDECLRKKFGMMARKQVADKFSLDTAVTEYANHYCELATQIEGRTIAKASPPVKPQMNISHHLKMPSKSHDEVTT